MAKWSAAADQRLIDEMNRLLVHLLERDVRSLAGGAYFQSVTAELLARRLDPYDAAARLLAGERAGDDGPLP